MQAYLGAISREYYSGVLLRIFPPVELLFIVAVPASGRNQVGASVIMNISILQNSSVWSNVSDLLGVVRRDMAVLCDFCHL